MVFGLTSYFHTQAQKYKIDKIITKDRIKKLGLILAVKFGYKPLFKFLIKKLNSLEDKLVEEFENLPIMDQIKQLLDLSLKEENRKKLLFGLVLGSGLVYYSGFGSDSDLVKKIKNVQVLGNRKRVMRRDTIVNYQPVNPNEQKFINQMSGKHDLDVDRLLASKSKGQGKGSKGESQSDDVF